MNCTNHQYHPDKNWRDDSGFYLKCAHCSHIEFFEVDTENELMELFGLADDDDYDDDYYEDDDDCYDDDD